MASSFKGWGSSWGQTWDRVTDPNSMYGAAAMVFTALGSLTAVVVDTTPEGGGQVMRFYAQPTPIFDNRIQRQNNDLLMLLL